MNWDHPHHQPFKQLRDESTTLRSWHIAKPLAQKQLKGQPLTEAERAYLYGFYNSNVCQEFFCRLAIPFSDNSPCWLKDGPPTEEQCQRCQLTHLATNVINFGQQETSEIAAQGTPIALRVTKDTYDITRFEWVTFDGDPSQGLTGEYLPGIQSHLHTPLSQVFPVCLPSLSPSFDDKCDHDCSNCPAHGFYDSVLERTTTGLGTVRLNNNWLPERVANQLRSLAQHEDTIPPSEQINPEENT